MTRGDGGGDCGRGVGGLCRRPSGGLGGGSLGRSPRGGPRGTLRTDWVGAVVLSNLELVVVDLVDEARRVSEKVTQGGLTTAAHS